MKENNALTEAENQTEKNEESILEHAQKGIYPDVKRMESISMMAASISPQYELTKKMTPEHITEFLKGQRETTSYQFKESRDSKILFAFALVVILVFIIVLIVILKNNPETMENVLYSIGGLLVGLLGGYGFGKTRNE